MGGSDHHLYRVLHNRSNPPWSRLAVLKKGLVAFHRSLLEQTPGSLRIRRVIATEEAFINDLERRRQSKENGKWDHL